MALTMCEMCSFRRRLRRALLLKIDELGRIFHEGYEEQAPEERAPHGVDAVRGIPTSKLATSLALSEWMRSAPWTAKTFGGVRRGRSAPRATQGVYAATTNNRWQRSLPKASIRPSTSSINVPSGPRVVTVAVVPGMNPASSR
jgi:hypothetical protein